MPNSFKGQKRIQIRTDKSAAFDKAASIIGFSEGEFQKQKEDKGNWTGGEVGKGLLVGTKYGISAASYPDLDIPNIDKSEALEIYWQDYWKYVACNHMPTGLAIVVFDAAILNGVGNAARWLQRTVGVADDGAIGPLTLKELAHDLAPEPEVRQWLLAADFQTQRLEMMRKLSTWDKYGGGWSIRLATLACKAAGAWADATRDAPKPAEPVPVPGLYTPKDGVQIVPQASPVLVNMLAPDVRQSLTPTPSTDDLPPPPAKSAPRFPIMYESEKSLLGVPVLNNGQGVSVHLPDLWNGVPSTPTRDKYGQLWRAVPSNVLAYGWVAPELWPLLRERLLKDMGKDIGE